MLSLANSVPFNLSPYFKTTHLCNEFALVDFFPFLFLPTGDGACLHGGGKRGQGNLGEEEKEEH